MTVFKQYFKMIKTYLPVILVYVAIFTILIIFFSTTGSNATSFQARKPKIAYITQDQSVITELLEQYLKDQTKIITIDPKQEDDALFYRQVDAIIKVPKDFGKSWEMGSPIKLEIRQVPDSSASVFLEQMINQFLKTATVYQKSGFTDSELKISLQEDLKDISSVQFLSKDQSKLEKVNIYYNFLNYIFLALAISIIGLVMSSFLDPNIQKRNLVSATTYRGLNRQLFLGNACFTFLLWGLFVGISIALYGTVLFTKAGLLIILNSLLFATTALSIGFLIGSIVKNKEAQNGITNILALGCSFIAGAFVPQEYLGNFVLTLAKFTPSYWFIKNNNEISLLSHFDFSSLQAIFLRMGMILFFTLLFFGITNFITKQKRSKHV